jgi:hypothetical protein
LTRELVGIMELTSGKIICVRDGGYHTRAVGGWEGGLGVGKRLPGRPAGSRGGGKQGRGGGLSKGELRPPPGDRASGIGGELFFVCTKKLVGTGPYARSSGLRPWTWAVDLGPWPARAASPCDALCGVGVGSAASTDLFCSPRILCEGERGGERERNGAPPRPLSLTPRLLSSGVLSPFIRASCITPSPPPSPPPPLTSHFFFTSRHR